MDLINEPMVSVPRELLVRLNNLCTVGWEDIGPELSELRALLDKPSCGACNGCADGCRLDRESPPAAQHQGEPVPCDADVYSNGKSVCLVDIPKETAEIICRSISTVAGLKVDWHYFGGRVHIKSLANPPEQPASVVVLMPDRMNETDAVQKLLGRFGVYGVVPADVATDIYNSALADVAKLNEVKGE